LLRFGITLNSSTAQKGPSVLEHVSFDANISLPLAWDWCEQGFCTPSWNQHIPAYCGACYVHGALSSAQDRIKIMNHRRGFTGADVMLSRQSFLNCAPGHGLSTGCDGGESTDVFEFMQRYGLPDESCLPYNATDHTKYTWTNGTCPPEGYCMNCMYTNESPTQPICYAVTKVVRYRAKEYGTINGEQVMLQELMKGPITCGIATSVDFITNYASGIYHDTTNFTFLEHDVEIVGFGVENGTKFWHVRNSWGTYWGENGFFKIVRGINNLGIESDCAYVVPDIVMEDLVWNITPSYTGSIFGLRPLNLNESNNIKDTTTDITVNKSLTAAPEKIIAITTTPPQPSTTNAVLPIPMTASIPPMQLQFITLLCALTVGYVVGWYSGRRHQYQRLS
ncbi:cathepsin B, cysteine protease family C01A, partial [Thraustotheca clavata]